jgi:hypothetical protein
MDRDVDTRRVRYHIDLWALLNHSNKPGHFSESSPPPVHPDASHLAPHLNTFPARSSLVSRRMRGPVLLVLAETVSGAGVSAERLSLSMRSATSLIFEPDG